jgi:hypothetical protein
MDADDINDHSAPLPVPQNPDILSDVLSLPPECVAVGPPARDLRNVPRPPSPEALAQMPPLPQGPDYRTYPEEVGCTGGR